MQLTVKQANELGELRQDAIDALGAYSDALNELATDLRSEWDEKSLTWQCSDHGVAYDEFITLIEEAADEADVDLTDLSAEVT